MSRQVKVTGMGADAWLLKTSDLDVLEELLVTIANNINNGSKKITNRDALLMFTALDNVIGNIRARQGAPQKLKET